MRLVASDDSRMPIAYGIVVSPDGLIVTKASEVDRPFAVDLNPSDDTDELAAAQIVAADAETDIALLRLTGLKSRNLPALDLNKEVEQATELRAGRWVISIDADPDGPGPADGAPLAIGNISLDGSRKIDAQGLRLGVATIPDGVAGLPVRRVREGGAAWNAGIRAGDLLIARDDQAISSRQDFINTLRFDRPSATFNLTIRRDANTLVRPVRLQNGRLGITFNDVVQGLSVAQVFPASPASEAGIEFGDLLTTVGGKPVTSFPLLQTALDEFRAGDRVKVQVVRDGLPRELEVRLGGIRSSFVARAQNFMGGSTFSRRSSDFPAVLQHDTVLPAAQMGGPIIDLEGRLVGMNIARAGRVMTYAIPTAELAQVVAKLKDASE